MLQGSAAEGANYSPSEETLQTFWQHCEDILGRTAMELPEPSLDADTQEQHLAHAKLEQVQTPFFLLQLVCYCVNAALLLATKQN